MNVCILGTSNGIISDGYVKAIKKCSDFSSINNLSLGASSCAFFPYRLNEIDWENTDLIFVESLVNDAASARAGAFDFTDIRLYYEDLIYQCFMHEVQLVCIVLPGRTKDAYYDSCIALLRDVLIEYNVTIWDIEKNIESHCLANQIGYMDLYRDAAHPHSWFLYEVSAGLLSKEFKPTVPSFKKDEFEQIKFISITDPNFTFELDDLDFKVINTSLLSAETKVIPKNICLEFKLNVEFLLHAFVLNSNNTNCVAEINGVKTIKKSFAFELKENNDKIIVSPLFDSVSSLNKKINLKVINDSDFSQKSYQANSPLIFESKLELVGLIYKKS